VNPAIPHCAVDDIASFRMFTSQLHHHGSATQPQLACAFGVPLVTVKRMCAKLRNEGRAGSGKKSAHGVPQSPSLLNAAKIFPQPNQALC
jgi:hypothetical protein